MSDAMVDIVGKPILRTLITLRAAAVRRQGGTSASAVAVPVSGFAFVATVLTLRSLEAQAVGTTLAAEYWFREGAITLLESLFVSLSLLGTCGLTLMLIALLVLAQLTDVPVLPG